ncbi:MAG: GTP-binding protein YchF [candidate division WS6 bacterium GW2011_GWC1_33_20]|uniref:GTP-binding protein YchF n=2 Tax=Candidatus Dojkabacteria TaxID=74243 RepID=A0A0G0AFI3_9BACT|nr:MAG: GTP-binding protein YchF [candidate division WS6 bacterium GW2011_GWE2_33_157]KKP44686.1 MAG: GTP-binding protein YchF [candidate division WS6 bacterium GW2011_GWC1_33_20]KKP45973.1 MAG: GTP-binding protein YchF [candidate division WS6 bacterium GW2011_GWF1_33_233]KKP55514.1 MAG: GTP-binding protein YchF [candidate division WS6 bacterium GW2011_GWB1_33_6]KKP55595.1 MAG: GTP-binding protein YchF [candidate division WS6 bacterium GW2011_WS6_33_547]KKP57005.1 MAG: GTP-binding protein YchF
MAVNMDNIVRSHTLSLGIVGLPNAGKSSLFNALTKKSVPAENYPFCTIDKNIGVVEIPDSRLDMLSKFFDAQKIVPSVMTFVDIAGLVKGASKGEGLGNQFLSHIREVDVIIYVLRAFNSEEIVHVYNRVDPVDDFEIVQSELIIKDLEAVEKRLALVIRNSKSGATDDLQLQRNVLEKAKNWLNEGKPIIDMKLTPEESEVIRELWLLTNKQRLFLLNCKEGLEGEKMNDWIEGLAKISNDPAHEYILKVDIKLLSDLANMQESELNEYIELLGSKPITVEDVILAAYNRLNLITFYTGSQKECNAWSIEKGANVKSAASVIHTDLGKNFITADVVNVDSMLKVGGWNKAKEEGLVKNMGREYIVNDGDYIIILANG